MRLSLTAVSVCLFGLVPTACQLEETGGTAGTTTVSDASGTTADATESGETTTSQTGSEDDGSEDDGSEDDGSEDDGSEDGGMPGCPTLVLDGPVDVDGDAELSALAGVTKVTDDLWITGSVTGLDDLACLETVEGRLNIYDAPALTSLAGLEQLSTVDRVGILDLPGLASLEGFAPDHIDELTLRELPALETLEGIESIRPFKVSFSLLEIDSLEPLSDMGPGLKEISIDELPQLESLAGLEGTSAVEILWVQESPVSDLSALATVGSLGDTLLGNTAVTNFDALSEVESIGSLRIVQAPALMDASGLDGVAVDGMRLRDCPLLTTAPAVVVASQGSYPVVLADMPALTSLGGMVMPAVFAGELELANLPVLGSISELSALQSVESLVLDNLGAVDLQPLSGLATVGGHLFLGNLDTPDLSFLSGLSSVGADLFVKDTALTDVSGLHDVDVNSQFVEVTGNTQLRVACIDALQAALIDGGTNAQWLVEANGGLGPCL